MSTRSSQRRHQKPVVTTSPAKSSSTTSDDSLRDSYCSYASQSTAPTSLNSAASHNKTALPTAPVAAASPRHQTASSTSAPQQARPFAAASSVSSVATYDSIYSEMEPLRRDVGLNGESEADSDSASSSGSDDDDEDDEGEQDPERDYVLSDPAADNIPPVLPPYRGTPTSSSPVRPSTPNDFARLFPSLDRLAIRHDDLTPDGNMNLRVDTIVPMSHGRRPLAMQLFHLRMHDLARREFSMRRYCRDSGREVCSAKRAYAEAPAVATAVDAARPALRRSVSSALRSVTTPFHRSSTATSLFKRPGSSSGMSSQAGDNASVWSGSHHSSELSHAAAPKPKPRLVPTNRIKLEFSNYAHVDVARRGGKAGKRYEFEWWGHTYAWKRVLDKNLDVVSFHLVRDGHGAPIAHIVPEMRSPNQVLNDEMAGAWVTPCYMWISDNSIIDAMTDVADVIVATGLIALVDDCIKERWQSKKPSRRAIASRAGDFNNASPRSFMQGFFQRRHSDKDHTTTSPLRLGRRPVAAY
ncbi:hypothetical protein G7046_g4326 [Stylonectria norvegica]|nr:hypothetical protein G7046_g4326 [Stylonectria norvegica]